MMQCDQCEYFQRNEKGEFGFSCDPFSKIVEPECLMKWQLIKINEMSVQVAKMSAAYQATLGYYQKLAPMQEKMFKFMEREIDDVDEADKWKYDDDDDEQEEDEPWNTGGGTL